MRGATWVAPRLLPEWESCRCGSDRTRTGPSIPDGAQVLKTRRKAGFCRDFYGGECLVPIRAHGWSTVPFSSMPLRVCFRLWPQEHTVPFQIVQTPRNMNGRFGRSDFLESQYDAFVHTDAQFDLRHSSGQNFKNRRAITNSGKSRQYRRPAHILALTGCCISLQLRQIFEVQFPGRLDHRIDIGAAKHVAPTNHHVAANKIPVCAARRDIEGKPDCQ